MENWDIPYSSMIGLKDGNNSKQIGLGFVFVLLKIIIVNMYWTYTLD